MNLNQLRPNKTTCPVIQNYITALNNNLSESERPRLIPYLRRASNTLDGKDFKRANILATAAITVFTPMALESAGINDAARNLRVLKTEDRKATRNAVGQAVASAVACEADNTTVYITNVASVIADSPMTISDSDMLGLMAIEVLDYTSQKVKRESFISSALDTLEKVISA